MSSTAHTEGGYIHHRTRVDCAGVAVDAEEAAVVAGQRVADPLAGPGQRGQDDADEETGVRGRVAHNAHARVQHQVRAG